MRRAQARRNRQVLSENRLKEVAAGIRDVAARYQRVAAEFERAEREYAEALLAAHHEGLTWAEVAAAAGLENAGQARLRAEKAMTPGEISPSRRRRDAASTPPEPVGVSVAEAARRLGVADSTVYARIDRGEIASTVDDLGRTRVLLD